MTSNLLLEIGTEEIPARFIDDIKDGMTAYLSKELKNLRIEYKSIKVKSTPRRFAIFIEDLSDRQKSSTKIIKGPAKKIAYDGEGKVSKALEGFLKSKGCTSEDVFIQEEKGQEYVFVNKTLPSESTENYFEKLFEDMVDSLIFAKPMKWGASKVKFIRPIRWILCLYKDKVQNLNMFGLKSSNITKGHRFLGSQEIRIDKISDYEKLLEENYCILDDEKRKSIIAKQITNVATSLGGHIVEDEKLLDEINYIVEYPTALYGQFDKKYLDLPKEAVITPMKEHQRYFPVLDDKDNLLAYFITVRNGDDVGIENVKKGNEKVLEARLADARFFYEQDTAIKLEDYLQRLDTVVYHEKLGTMTDKTARIGKIAEKIAKLLSLEDKDILRAAKLCKADLTTSMVSEFTELQGIMGGYYALNSGENQAVATAIREHYLPGFAGDKLPETVEAAVLSLSDKLDCLCGFFSAGIQPTGSQDPYALRRQTIGIIHILMDKKLDITVFTLLKLSLDVFKEKIDFDYDKTYEDLMEFVNLRVKNILLEEGIKYDIIDAVLNDSSSSVYRLWQKAIEISMWLGKEDKVASTSAFIRVINIAKDEKAHQINKDLFEEDIERKLYNEYENIEDKVDTLISDYSYNKALDTLSDIAPVIDEYFEKVMINVDNKDIKTNRLSQVCKIRDAIVRIADFSKLVL